MFNALTKLFVDTKIRLTRDETGATAVEYGLIVGLIAVVIIGAVAALGGTLSGMFTTIDTKLTTP